MGLRYRKSKSFGGVRVTASKSGIGFSTGVKGFRVTKKAGGGYRTTASIPGTGISYVKDYSAGSRRRRLNQQRTYHPPPRKIKKPPRCYQHQSGRHTVPPILTTI